MNKSELEKELEIKRITNNAIYLEAVVAIVTLFLIFYVGFWKLLIVPIISLFKFISSPATNEMIQRSDVINIIISIAKIVISWDFIRIISTIGSNTLDEIENRSKIKCEKL